MRSWNLFVKTIQKPETFRGLYRDNPDLYTHHVDSWFDAAGLYVEYNQQRHSRQRRELYLAGRREDAYYFRYINARVGYRQLLLVDFRDGVRKNGEGKNIHESRKLFAEWIRQVQHAISHNKNHKRREPNANARYDSAKNDDFRAVYVYRRDYHGVEKRREFIMDIINYTSHYRRYRHSDDEGDIAVVHIDAEKNRQD